MTRNVIFGTMFSAALAVGVAAQTGSQDPQSQRERQQQQPSQQGQQITVQGCLQSADIAGGAAGTSGTGTTGTQQQQQQRSGAQFMLTNAKVTSGGPGTSGTTGTTGTTPSISDTKFMLTGGNQQELRQYVNSQVEIRGTLQKSSAPGGGTGTGTGSGYGTGSQKEQTGVSDVKTVRVTSVKQISPNCQ